MAKVTVHDMVEAVKAKAISLYEKSYGMQCIIESLDDEGIIELIEGARSISGAIRKAKEWANLQDEARSNTFPQDHIEQFTAQDIEDEREYNSGNCGPSWAYDSYLYPPGHYPPGW